MRSRWWLPALLVPALAGAQGFERDVSDAIERFRRAALPIGRAPSRPSAPPRAAAPAPTQVEVGDPWTDRVRAELYRNGRPAWRTKLFNGLILQDPLIPSPLLAPMLDPFRREKAREIARTCRARWPLWWDRIGCVSRTLHAELKDRRFRLPATPCKTYAQAFDLAFAELGLRSAISLHVDASGPGFGELHVANAVLVQDARGAVYNYVIDSGWFPGRLFPKNDLAIMRHDRNGDGRTDDATLPEISEDPRPVMRAAPGR